MCLHLPLLSSTNSQKFQELTQSLPSREFLLRCLSRRRRTLSTLIPLLITMNLSRSTSSSPSSTITTSNNQACASCKYQRRKCAPDCILAPYFPHDRQRQFLNAHKLFGVRNITKIIEKLDPHDRDQAMRTIIYQSDMRANDPVGGCYRYIQELHAQIEYHRAELDLVLQQLAVFRAQAHHHHHHGHHQHHDMINTEHLNLYNPIAAPNHYHYLQQMPHQQEPYIMMQGNHNHTNSNNNNSMALQDDVNSWGVQDSMSLSSLSLQNKNGGVNGYVGDELYDDHKSSSMLDIHCDERNELGFDPEELVESSDETVLFKMDNAMVKGETDCIQQVQDHDLKGAATLFTLTNCTS